MNNLNVGGAEKALVSMLQIFDFEKYEVDLLLFKKEGLFLKQVPKKVNILPEPKNYKFFDMPFTQVIHENIFKNWKVIFWRLQFNAARKGAKNNAEAEQFGWKPLSQTLQPLVKNYDAAIGFLEKNPNYFVVDKVRAIIKIGWIHNDYDSLGMNSSYDEEYFRKLDAVATMSDQALEVLRNRFPNLKRKFLKIENINANNLIMHLKDEFPVQKKEGINIISIGRLTAQKNYELGIEAAKILKERNITFEWLILGEGNLRKKLEESVRFMGLDTNIKFLGAVENPYPYLKNADIFLQTSLFEGKSVAINEAKILRKNIVLTNFNTAKEQITHGWNGIVCDMDAEKIADVILELANNAELQDLFATNLSEENWDTQEEIQKLYMLIDN